MKKINVIWLLLFLTLGAMILRSSSCQDDEEIDTYPPNVVTTKVFKITDNSATVEAEVVTANGDSVTVRGLCWCTSPIPTTDNNVTSSGSGCGCFECCMTGLSPNTTYYVRGYATNENGTDYGNIITFTTPPLAVDIEGNTYHTVKIGDQVWMSENLRVIHFSNGAMIPKIDNNTEWANTNTAAYCIANNGTEIFYNAYAAVDGRNLAPAGWHVATDEDWKILEGTVDSQFAVGDPEWEKIMERGSDAGGNLKTVDGWMGPNTGATNLSGFSAVPVGWRWGNTGEIAPGGGQASFWTSTPVSGITSWARAIFYDDDRIHRNYYENTYGGSIRCVKD
jgi:uncharacterized protein (TIGR02145 family)